MLRDFFFIFVIFASISVTKLLPKYVITMCIFLNTHERPFIDGLYFTLAKFYKKKRPFYKINFTILRSINSN
ncbi:MAG: hypothetical protein ACI8QG_002618 [Flavobacteriales bacterium]|jgi:hypothetical protein